jgi:hypothetical protein
MSAESSRTIHGAVTCLDACRYYGGLIVGALQGASKEEILSKRYEPIKGLWERAPLCPEIDEIACGSFKRKEPPEIVGSGYVGKSLEAALRAFSRASTFKEGWSARGKPGGRSRHNRCGLRATCGSILWRRRHPGRMANMHCPSRNDRTAGRCYI